MLGGDVCADRVAGVSTCTGAERIEVPAWIAMGEGAPRRATSLMGAAEALAGPRAGRLQPEHYLPEPACPPRPVRGEPAARSVTAPSRRSRAGSRNAVREGTPPGTPSARGVRLPRRAGQVRRLLSAAERADEGVTVDADDADMRKALPRFRGGPSSDW